MGEVVVEPTRDGSTTRLRPLTERILGHLPGARWIWIALWSLVPWLNAGGNLILDTEGAVWDQSRTLVILNYAALSLAVVITLWGTGRIASRLEVLGETTSTVLDGDDASASFRRINSLGGPILLSGATSIVFGVSALGNGSLDAVLRAATWLVLGVAFWTFLWTYVVLQLGLHRLGGVHLRVAAAPVDPGLGLRPLGDVAFMGLWMLLAWLVPVLLTGLPDIAGVAVGVLVLIGGLAAFFLSLFRLHRQMVEVKERELAIARDLYAQAYAPVRAAPTLEALEQQQRLLAAADSLERRARAIHDWPINEGTFASVLTITTSVIAVTIARLILDPFGL